MVSVAHAAGDSSIVATSSPASLSPFLPNVKITDGSSPYAWQVEPTMVVNRSGTVFVGWKETDSPEAAGIRVGASYSTDQGLTWAPNILMNQSHPNSGCHNSDAWMALAPDDRVQYAYLEYDCNSYFDITNTTNGQDWGTVHSVVGNGGLVDKDSIWVAPNGRIYASWDEGNVLAVTWSDDGGSNWQRPFIDPDDTHGASVLGTVIETASNGTVYLVWWDFSRNNIYFDWSLDGSTWHTDKRVNDRDGSAAGSGWQISLPAMNVDQRSGAIYVAWPDTRDGNLNIYTSSSTDGGATWSANKRVNDDTGGAIQYMVDLAIDSKGTVHAAWEDKRTGGWNIFYSNSTDGGQTWAPNVRVSSEDTPGSYNRPGDYFAIEAGPNDYIYVVWTDGRGSDFDIYYARSPGFPVATITVATSPLRFPVTIDGATARAPVTNNWTIGSDHNISVPATIPIDATTRYVWTGWSDNGAIAHTIVADADRTITASFQKQYLAKIGPDPTGLNVRVDNVSYNALASFWWDAGSTHWVEAPSPQAISADVRYVWSSWSDGGAPAHVVAANGGIAITAMFVEQQAMVVSTAPDGLTFSVDGTGYSAPTTFWFEPGSYHTVSVGSPQAGGPGTRYRFVSWSDGGAATHVVPFTAATSLQATFSAEYYLTVTSPVPGASGSGWYPSGATALATVTTDIYAAGSGERLTFQKWSGDATGTGLTSDTIVMDGPKTATAQYTTQYFLEVSSPYGTPSGSGWYDAGSSATASVSPGTIGAGTGRRVVFAQWSGDAAGSSASGSDPILMSAPLTAQAEWTTEYYLQVNSDVGTVEGSGWYASGTSVTLQADPQTMSGGQTYRFAGWTGAVTSGDATVVVTVNGPMTIRATWTTVGLLGGISGTVWGLIALVIAIAALIAVILVWRHRRKA